MLDGEFNAKKVIGIIIFFGKTIVGVFGWIGRLILKGGYWSLVVGIPLGIIWYLAGVTSLALQYRHTDDHRGAATIESDSIDDRIDRENIQYLEQNWSENQSLWFYNISQGSNLLPYDFFIALEQKDNSDEFKSNKNINKYRYLPQIATDNNLDALPVGFVKDSYKGKDYVGFSCAACHTSQINYNGVGIRIDGGPAAADMESFLLDMVIALEELTKSDDANFSKKERFYEHVIDKGDYKSKQEIDTDLTYYTKRLKTYTQVNEPVWPKEYKPEVTDGRVTHYGYSRLDAFGRIYNRVLQHVMGLPRLKEILRSNLPTKLYSAISIELDKIEADQSDQLNIIVRVLSKLELEFELLEVSAVERARILTALRSSIYNPANAPASYPYLWDISQHDYVQWTGLVSNSGLGPLGRNVGQVIGVFGTLDWQRKKAFTISPQLGGASSASSYKLDFKSSINKVNLRRVENQLQTLQSPKWPSHILPSLNDSLVEKGEQIFDQYCLSCHQNIDSRDPARRVITHINKLESVGTDPVLALNTVGYKGNSGLIRNEYVDGSLGKLSIEEEMPVASLVKFSSREVVLEPDPDRWPIFRNIEWAWGILKSLKDNPVKEKTARKGNYDLPTPQKPLSPLRVYKARSLNGVWATAPYLHNGSIPNLYELLLPKKQEKDPDLDKNGMVIEYRSDQFMVGSREFDPKKVGFISSGYDGFLYDTSVRGNSNEGHEYAAGRNKLADGTELKPLSKTERLALLEYLKSIK